MVSRMWGGARRRPQSLVRRILVLVLQMLALILVASILATAPSQPVLYVEFRKDGTPIDPSPWWAASEGEKVRG